jgi:2-polyprenyl-6-methoxyphenol hydroxylase-like FAD-dependent oxidoreductase
VSCLVGLARSSQRVLISGASIAGPVLAYWLSSAGYRVTVVERAAEIRTGLTGHAVDLFGAAVDIAEEMGVLPKIEDAQTHGEQMWWERPRRRMLRVDVARFAAGMTERHVEVMRGELVRILYEHTREDVEYLFNDSVVKLEQDADGVDVSFERGAPGRFDLVIGADGLHSRVRRLAFGPEELFRHELGGHAAVFSVRGETPDEFGPPGVIRTYAEVDRLAVVYPVRQTGQSRVVLLWRGAPVNYHHQTVGERRRAVASAFADSEWLIPKVLARMQSTEDLYVDTISQIRMNSWSKGRVTLVGDAGYAPGPAVGGGTSLAMVGGYLLAKALVTEGGDHERGFVAYEHRMAGPARAFQEMAPKLMRSGIPDSALRVELSGWLLRIWLHLPIRIQRALSAAQGGPARAFNSVDVERIE